jgi:hypothetical protein
MLYSLRVRLELLTSRVLSSWGTLSPFGVGAAAVITLAPAPASARPSTPPDRYEVSVVGGYRFAGSFDIEEEDDRQLGEAHYDGAPAFGASIGYRTQLDGLIYLWYGQQNTEVELTVEGAEEPTTTRDVTFHYLQFGGYIEGAYGPTVPYLGVSVGLTLFDPSDDVGAEFKPSAAVEGGFKVPLTSNLHLRLLGRLPFTLLTGKTQVFCIEPEGCSVSFDGKPVLQAELAAGLGVTF